MRKIVLSSKVQAKIWRAFALLSFAMLVSTIILFIR